jgi:hypothetical protein
VVAVSLSFAAAGPGTIPDTVGSLDIDM